MKNIKKIIILIITIFLLSCNSTTNNAVEISKSDLKKYEEVFKDLKEYLYKEDGELWNHQLYGSLFFVDKNNRIIIANEKDNKGILSKRGEVYVGILPKEINIANTAFDWNGKIWTMVMLPLPKNYNERLNLLTHELFHRIQPEVGFANLLEKQSNHLDYLDGRIYIKLELEALKKALLSDDELIRNKHIENALQFRNYRYEIYDGAKEIENTLELKEGLAEYTGSILSKRTDENLKKHYIEAINNFYNNPTFVKSFAYRTIPVYGYLMNLKDRNWNKKVSKKTNLTDFIMAFFNVKKPLNLKEYVRKTRMDYSYKKISEFEIIRDNKRKSLIAEYELKFQQSPVLVIQFENMNIGYNPSNIMPLNDLGTVYPNLRVTDNWGVLTVENGALLSNNWDKVTVSKPTKISEKIIKGDGWNLELNKDWKLEKIEKNYTLIKK